MAFLCSNQMSHISSIYISCLYLFYIVISTMYILYIICNLIFKYSYAFPQQMKKPNFCLDCKWIDPMVLNCYFKHYTVHLPHESRCDFLPIYNRTNCVRAYLWLALPLPRESLQFARIFDFSTQVWKSYNSRKSVEQWNVKQTTTKIAKEEEISNTYCCCWV